MRCGGGSDDFDGGTQPRVRLTVPLHPAVKMQIAYSGADQQEANCHIEEHSTAVGYSH